MEAGGQEIHCDWTPYYRIATKAGAKLQIDSEKTNVIWDPY